ncbi:hypothetical protein VOLCADRAFT_121376 [Volvox carteri f. nagariensis]|uniref:Uncharacterized protein n=1 Tax=Volvox carteri f. nagariensis TaxID=3068 RepID=D8U8X4_VOLCA|nr:uncharacterized protein VOLCADRAFT_121376 [Volvox carteri f. nagariensis]EFJ43882.1 hypothetical protein VOLCADRAFT_121376 [Volvox carteri f. nagariensis]|eukprot:XP_002955128.1 hypothetical protein VOLCADRAFT_121376 [Volvox carteri f. nagariensis]
MGTNPGVDVRIGWDESEQKEFMKAIRQPLMVQTPLQLVIENLFQRLQAQASFVNQMKEKMDRIAVKDVSADELLHRIKLLEAQQGDAAGPKLNPFNQQEILNRLEALEKKLADGVGEKGSGTQRDRQPSRDDSADLEIRLSRLEKRLTGVYNINGKLVAVEQIASGLGVAIPDLEYPTGGGPQQQQQQPPAAAAGPAVQPLPQVQAWRPPAAPAGPQQHSTQQLAPMDWTRPRAAADATAADAPGDDAAAPVGSRLTGVRSASPGMGLAEYMLGGAQPHSAPQTRGSSPSHSPRLVGTPSSPRLLGSPSSGGAAAARGGLGSAGGAGGASGGPVSAQKLVQLGQEVTSLRTENDSLRNTVDSLLQQVSGLRAGLGSNAVESLSRLQQVEEGVSALRAQVADLAAARRDAAARSGSEVTFADFSLLRSQVEGAVAEAKAQAAAAATLAERELPALAARVDELAEALKKKGEPRDIDALFHERINGLETAMGEMKTELLGSIESALEAAVKVDDLQALEEVLEAKAPFDAVRLLQQQTHALGQAVAGISDAIALRPDLGEALRAGAAGGGPAGPLATKLRCLTCDQPIKNLPGLGSLSAGGAAAAATAKGSFLPRLESMPAKEGLPGGPGLMIADLRSSKEDRLAGLQVGSGVPGRGPGGGGGGGVVGIKPGDLEEYVNGVGGLAGLTGSGTGQRDGSPGRAVERSRAARVPVGAPGLSECLAGEMGCCGDSCCSSAVVSRALAEYCQHSDAAREAFVAAKGLDALQVAAPAAPKVADRSNRMLHMTAVGTRTALFVRVSDPTTMATSLPVSTEKQPPPESPTPATMSPQMWLCASGSVAATMPWLMDVASACACVDWPWT